MKCKNCGEFCNENQVFCLKCGTPVYQDNSSEQSTNNLLKGEEGDRLVEEEEDNLPQKVEVELSVQDMEEWNRQQRELEEKKQEMLKKKKAMQAKRRKEEMQQAALRRQQLEEQKKKEKKAARRKIIGIIFVVLIIISAGVTAAVFIRGCATIKEETSFEGYYKNGLEYLEKQQYDKALTELLKAKKLMTSEDQNYKLKVALWKAYINVSGKDVEAISVLKELLEQEPENIDYYNSLIKIYQDTSRTDDLKEVLAKLEGTEIANKLEIYKLPAPIPDTDEGKYNYFFSVKLSSEENASLYYKLYEGETPSQEELDEIAAYDSNQVKENLKKYKKGIYLGHDITYTLVSIAISDRDIPSHMMVKTYELELDVISGPEVTPESGDFTENTKIKIKVPKGCKAYYTFGDEEIPTKKSHKYVGAIDMPRGNSCLNVILINDKGKKSEIVTRVYNLTIPRNVDYDAALNKLKKYFVAEGIVIDTEGNRSNGGKIDITYLSNEVIKNQEFYLVEVQYYMKNGSEGKKQYYGISTEDGLIVQMEPKKDSKKDEKDNKEKETEIYNGQNSEYQFYEGQSTNSDDE